LEAGAQGTERESARIAARRKEEDLEEALRRARTWGLVRHARAVDVIFEALVVELPQSAKQSFGLASRRTMRSANPRRLTFAIERMRGVEIFR
jgi:hypothetical protein